MKKIIKTLDRLVTVDFDTSKHVVGAVYCLWITLILTGFVGAVYGFYFSVLCYLLFIAWEVMFMITDKKPFSVKDVVSASLVMIPITVVLYLYIREVGLDIFFL